MKLTKKMLHLAWIVLVVIALAWIAMVLFGCASVAAIEGAHDAIISLQDDLDNVVTKAAESGQFNEEQLGILNEWKETATPIINQAETALKPKDIGEISKGIAGVGRVIGGPVGTILGLIGIAGTAVAERRGRNRTVRRVVASVEHGREGATVDWNKVEDAQRLMGIQRLVSDATKVVTGKVTPG